MANTMNNFELLYSLFNQYVFNQAKSNIDAVEYYYSTNPETQNSPLVGELLKAIRNYPLESIDLPLFKSIFSRCNKTAEESEQILKDIVKWKQYTKDQMIPAKQYLDDLAASSILRKASSMYKDSPSLYLKYCKNSTFQSSDTSVFTSTPISEIDINSLLADNPNDFIPSRYQWINNTFDPYPGYERGQMVLVSAAPGVGKTLWLMSEALGMASAGYKVLYISLGDNKMKDFIVRMSAIFTGDSFSNVHRNLLDSYKQLNAICGGNLEISINAANKVSAEDIVSLATAKKAEVVIVDYDGNLKGVDVGENMYHTFGAVYATLNELVLQGKLLFIASQPVKAAWNAKVIEMQDIGESARKQQTADMIIGIGREIDSPNHLHTFKISKSRRGEVDVYAYTIRLNNGRFKQIPKQLYDDILHPLSGPNIKRNFSEAEINAMIDSYNNQFGGRGNIITPGQQVMPLNLQMPNP
jgi:archaellum biogenesis ATPase FlaH